MPDSRLNPICSGTGPRRVDVLNPNSTEACTRSMADGVAPLAEALGLSVYCHTLLDGPPGVESQADIADVAHPIASWCRDYASASNALVIACFSDPALDLARESVSTPVFGIAECAIKAACIRADRFGLIAIKQASVLRQRKYVRRMGLLDRFAGGGTVGLSVPELADAERTRARMIEVGNDLVRRQGADVLIMGCAGMAAHRATLEAETGVPVSEPTQAAVVMAAGLSALPGWNNG